MRSSLLIPALAGLATAIPYDSSAENGLSKRASTPAWCPYVMNWLLCMKLPNGTGPSITPDTVAAFTANSTFSQAANGAVTPSTYVRTFQNLNGATSTSNYLGFYELPSYNASACAAKCDSTRKCTAFNLYFERDPTMTTDPNCCPNPASLTRIKCSLWGTNTTPTTANNQGQMRDSFQVAIAGSNGYNKQLVFTSSSSSTALTSATSAKSSVASSTPVTTTTKSSGGSSINAGSSINGGASIGSSGTPSVASSVGASKSSAASSVASSASSGIVQNNINAASAGSSPGSSVPSSVASSAGSPVGASITPSVTASPTLGSGSSNTLSGLAVSSQSASVASDAAAQPVTDDVGSPVTASIATSATPCSTPVAVPELTFNLNRTTYSTQTLYMYGSIDQLGEWDPSQAVPLSSSNVPGTTNWFASLNITSGTYFEYKYFIRNPDWSITWPPVANRNYTVPTSCQQEIVISDTWATTDQTSS